MGIAMMGKGGMWRHWQQQTNKLLNNRISSRVVALLLPINLESCAGHCNIG